MKHIAVILATSDLARQREAMRAAVGLGLRGDRVTVVAHAEPADDDPHVGRALATLAQLGQRVARGRDAPGDADIVEVWT